MNEADIVINDIEVIEGMVVELLNTTPGAKIKAIGVGGGGSNMIDHMISQGIEGIDLIVVNTDAQALDSSNAPYKLQLGLNTTRGLGAGNSPEKGREAALESFEEVKKLLEGADIVFISAGLGGGTGTGAAPIIAQAAKEVDALTVSVVTTPFKFEGKKRTLLAKIGLDELKMASDSIIVVPNEKLLSIIDKSAGWKDSFKIVDDILSQAVSGISNVILVSNATDMNVDFADVKKVMSHRGIALMGSGYSSGSNAAHEAAKNSIESPLLDNFSIDGAMGVLIHFHFHAEYPMLEISEAMTLITDSIENSTDDNGNHADVIIGTTTTTDSMETDEVRVTIVATGFEGKVAKVNPDEKQQDTLSHQTPSLSNNIDTRQMEKRLAVGDYENNNESLDTPSFIRNQKD